jgi:hypothetical protein
MVTHVEAFYKHMKTQHQVDDEDIDPLIMNKTKKPYYGFFDLGSCPLCREWRPPPGLDFDEFIRHYTDAFL